jgi:molybdopterin-guanine dinucleotide biosynthesis protein A
MTKPLGVILAGGLASRMGGDDKALLDLGGTRLIDQVIDRIAPQVSELALNANGDPVRFAEFGMPIIPDSIEGFAGPLAGVLAGLDWAANIGGDTIVTVAGDTPFFPIDLVKTLETAARKRGTDLALAATIDPVKGQVRHPTFGIWPVALRDDLRDALTGGLRKVVLWTEKHNAASALFEIKDRDPFFNINTPDELEIAQKMLAGNTE